MTLIASRSTKLIARIDLKGAGSKPEALCPQSPALSDFPKVLDFASQAEQLCAGALLLWHRQANEGVRLFRLQLSLPGYSEP
jgi:hypothetical protein